MTATRESPTESAPASEGSRRGSIDFRDVSRWYGNVVAVNNISFSIGPGITGLLGPNGAGKSTILHMASGLLKPSRGEVEILGRPVWHDPDIYEHVGLVPERESLYAFLTGYEVVELSAKLHRVPNPAAAAAAALKAVGLEDAQDRRVGEYSKGMRQRCKVAAAIVHDPSVLLLDEPFNGADPYQRLHMMEFLRRMAANGWIILFSSHILEEVERLAENVLVIVSGRLAASGNYHEIRRLMSDRPHTFRIRSSDDRRLAVALIGQECVAGVQVGDGQVEVSSSDFASFTRVAARVARDSGVIIYEFKPEDESLESVFSYLVNR